jgi:hypothetical protein
MLQNILCFFGIHNIKYIRFNQRVFKTLTIQKCCTNCNILFINPNLIKKQITNKACVE